eukprot:TRINITY_DN3507_c0_g1_i3.p1 TRINITY_DN3507_c0_g1~~TRINITY_DN3507_c0_g1_i3.p1  ORF type:complete len:298 (+),score=60.06 TRINITY_DN3507_c0_g1_i3:81-974(+)
MNHLIDICKTIIRLDGAINGENKKFKVPSKFGEVEGFARRLGYTKPTYDDPKNECLKDFLTNEQNFLRVELSNKLKEEPRAVKKGPKVLDRSKYSAKDLELLEKIKDSLHVDYESRHKMMQVRLDITIRSCLWSERAKRIPKAELAKFNARKQALLAPPKPITLDDVFEEDSSILEEMGATASTQNKSSFAKLNVVTGDVPHRGGAVMDRQIMPSWCSFSGGQVRSGRGGGQNRGRGQGRGQSRGQSRGANTNRGGRGGRGGNRGGRGGYQGDRNEGRGGNSNRGMLVLIMLSTVTI